MGPWGHLSLTSQAPSTRVLPDQETFQRLPGVSPAYPEQLPRHPAGPLGTVSARGQEARGHTQAPGRRSRAGEVIYMLASLFKEAQGCL